MDRSLNPYRGYEAVGHPTVAVREGRVVFLNRAARSLCDRDYLDAAAAELLGEELAALAEESADVLMPGCRFLDQECTLKFLAGDPAFYLFELGAEAERELGLRNALLSLSSSLRNPLGLMLQALDSIRTEELDERNNRYFVILERAIFQLTGLAQHMSLAGDLSSSEATLRSAYGDVTELLQRCVGQCGPIFAALSIPLEVSLPSHSVVEACDAEQLELLVMILLSIALGHCDGGTVTLSLGTKKGRYAIDVSFPAANNVGLEEMFDLLSGRGATDEGLSLHVAWQIARLHRGRLLIRRSPEEVRMTADLYGELPCDFLRQPRIFPVGIPPVLTEFAPLLESPDFHALRTALGQRSAGRVPQKHD